MSAVYRRELKANLFGMTGPIFIAFVLVLLGLYSANFTFNQSIPNLEYALLSASFLSLLAVPLLTMRAFPEERHAKTDQLLYSLPISTTDIVLGKYFSMITIFAIPTAVVCLFPLVSAIYCSGGSINFINIYGAILCYYLLGCAVIGVCMFLSTLTESQVISAIFSIGVILLLYFMTAFANMLPSTAGFSLAVVIAIIFVIAYIVWISIKNYVATIATGVVLLAAAIITYIVKSSIFDGLAGKIVNGISLFAGMDNFVYGGSFDIGVIIYYLSAIVLFAFFTIQAVEKRRWS